MVLGPTGAGKSELSIALAEAFKGEIVNCDSIQVYRGLDIGSAKQSLEQRRAIPHHLIDILDADQELTAGAYSRAATQVISQIHTREGLPIVTGGTGFYLRALLDGLSPAPMRDEKVRERLRKVARRRPGALHRLLRRFDADAAARIHPNDLQKLIRAIEMMWLARQPVTTTQSRPREALLGVSVLKIGLAPDRKLLYQRLNERAAWMFHNGLLEETERLLRSRPEAKPLQSLGYRQAVKVLRGRMEIEQAIAECQTKTRQYAKRQMTWFRKETGVHWLRGFGSDPAIQDEAIARLAEFLN